MDTCSNLRCPRGHRREREWPPCCPLYRRPPSHPRHVCSLPTITTTQHRVNTTFSINAIYNKVICECQCCGRVIYNRSTIAPITQLMLHFLFSPCEHNTIHLVNCGTYPCSVMPQNEILGNIYIPFRNLSNQYVDEFTVALITCPCHLCQLS